MRRQLVTDRQTSERLGRIRQRGTDLELDVRTEVRLLGHSYRLNNRDLAGSPDIANRRRRWAIFVHGCFWHSHPGCRRSRLPKRNREFWRSKMAANRARDMRVVSELKRDGYATLVVWGCEVASRDTLQRLLRKFFARLVE